MLIKQNWVNYMDQSFFLKFPCVLKKVLQDETVVFPEDCKIDFEDFIAYRAISRNNDDCNIKKEDFLSQMELFLKGKKIRPYPKKDNINSYSCSLYTDKEKLKIILHLPRKSKKIIKGYVNDIDGIITVDDNAHVNWWLYENSDPSDRFEVIGNE